MIHAPVVFFPMGEIQCAGLTPCTSMIWCMGPCYLASRTAITEAINAATALPVPVSTPMGSPAGWITPLHVQILAMGQKLSTTVLGYVYTFSLMNPGLMPRKKDLPTRPSSSHSKTHKLSRTDGLEGSCACVLRHPEILH